MASLRKHNTKNTASDSDDDAPESVSLAQSRSSVKAHENAMREAHHLLRKKRKEENRAKDETAKARAALRKEEQDLQKRDNGKQRAHKRKEIDVSALEARMSRAMDEAEDEESDEDEISMDMLGGTASGSELEEDDSDGDGQFDRKNIDDASSTTDEELDNHPEELVGRFNESDELMDEDGEVLEDDSAVVGPSQAYLPEEMFSAAFSAPARRLHSSSVTPSSQKSTKKRSKKLKTRDSAKEIVLGSRAIRVLPQNEDPVLASARHAAPSKKINKFLDRQLKLKNTFTLNSSAKSKHGNRGWERKPADLGVFKRAGPATHFVRRS